MTGQESSQQAQDLLKAAKAVCILTGAGISAESGLKTFREADGLWEEHRIEDVATLAGFTADPALVWRFYNARRKAAASAAPNAAHLALARMEAGFKHRRKETPAGSNGNGHPDSRRAPAPLTILTQNIDGLHQQAGSLNVVELHGSLWRVRCTGCGVISNDFPVELPLLPACAACDGLLRPNVVWFGESLEPDVVAQADAAVMACDLFLLIGTSALVRPAAAYPFIAARRNVPVIEVNKEHTPASAIATVLLKGKAGDILPKIIPV